MMKINVDTNSPISIEFPDREIQTGKNSFITAPGEPCVKLKKGDVLTYDMGTGNIQLISTKKLPTKL